MDSLKNKLYISLVLVIVVIIYVVFIFNKNTDIETKLDEVKLKTEINEISKNSFAIMVEKEDGSGYEEVDNFPEGLPLNEELTGCIDVDGKKLENAISYSDGVVSVNINSTAYCYLYFDYDSSFGNQLLQTPTTGLNTTLEGGLYRYQGTSVDNYICFGTSDKDACLGNIDAYMYRIIGITDDKKVKLIKKEALSPNYTWGDGNISWNSSNIYSSINGSSFLTNTTYVPNGWEDKISLSVWVFGDNTISNISAPELFDIEILWNATVESKIALMYLHDYYYAYQSGGLNCSSSGAYNNCKASWIHLSVNDSQAMSPYEWTMSRYGSSKGYAINSNGVSYTPELSFYTSIRPVFFLKSDIQLIGGTGKSDDPFIIS